MNDYYRVIDAHGPHQGCNFQKCGNPSSGYVCPFLKEEKLTGKVPKLEDITVEHKHEWRQHFIEDHNSPNRMPYLTPDGWYCIHCRTIEKN